jgi:hypothetical protein
MKFIYENDGLGDKLVCGKYLVRPVIYNTGEAEPSTFEDFDRHALYLKVNGLDEWLGDFDTVAEAISEALNHHGN